jgi:hypothetical protein
MKYLKLFEGFKSAKRLILKDGDLANRLEEFGFKDELVSDIFDYMADENVEKLKPIIKAKWPHVETVNSKNFPIFRGFSIENGHTDYEFWNKILGDKETTFDGAVFAANDTVEYSVPDYSSWSVFHSNAEGYADARPGDIKVVLITDVKSVKVFANLFEIGDESEELIVYPILNHTFRFKAWRKNK